MGNLVKTVELRILANAGDAQQKIDDLAAKSKELDGNEIKMRFRLDGERDAKTQLDEIRAKATEAGFRDVSIKVKVDGAGKAIADLAAVKHEEDKVRDTGILNRLGGLYSSAIGGAGGIPFVGGIASSGGGLGLAALIPAIGALATELVGVASGFAAAATGAGAFAVLALPAVKQVETAYQALGKAQQAFRQAQAREAADPSKANAAALQRAALNLKLVHEQIGKMPASEQAALSGIQRLASEFGKMSRAFQPQAFKVFADGLKVVGSIMPHITPFASTFATGLDKLLQQAAKFTQSKGFSDWLKQFHSLEGPAIQSIGHGIGEIANSFGKLMTVMSGKDVAHALNIMFGGISGTINVVTSAIHRFMENFDGMKAAATSAVHGTVGAFKSMASGVSSAVSAVIGAWKSMVRGIEQGVSAAISAVSSLPGKIKGFFAGAAGWLVQAGKNIISGLIHGIESMAGAVRSPINSIASKIRSFLPFSPAKEGPLSGAGSPDIAGAKIVEMMAGGIGSKGVLLAMAMKKALEGQRKVLVAEMQQSVQVAQAALQEMSITNAAGAGPSGEGPPGATSLIQGMQFQLSQVKAFAQQIAQLKHMGLNSQTLSQIIGAGVSGGLPIAQSITGGGKDAVSQINQLEKQLRAAAGKLGDASARPMYQAGQQAAQGLAQGIRSQLGAVDAAIRQLVKSMVGAVKDGLKIKSPSLVMRELGQYSGHGLELGLRDSAPRVSAASRSLARATAGGYASGGAGMTRGGDGGMSVHFHSLVATPQDARKMVQVLREYKRTGGNAALGIA